MATTRRHPKPDELEPIEWASTDELRDLQFRRLRAILVHAWKNMAPYRAKCGAAGVARDDPEIIDPESGKPLADGKHGELVITTLTKEALPVIRYRTHDLTRLLPGTARTMRRLERIEERVPQQPGLSPHYQLRVSKQGNLDLLAVHVERDADIPSAKSEAIASALRQDIKDHVGVTTVVEVHEPGGVARSTGKAVRVVDERQ